jgi:acetylornithine/N-succinyldiaminopimelate aminotransferase
MAIGDTVMDVMTAPGFLDEVNAKANRLNQSLGALVDEYPAVIEAVRGKGLLLGLKCKIPCKDLQSALVDLGMLTITAGDNVLRLLPPLVVTDSDIDAALDMLHKACAGLAAPACAA